MQLGLGARIGHHAARLLGDLLAGAQLSLGGGLEELLIGKRIPQVQREPRGHVVVIRRARPAATSG